MNRDEINAVLKGGEEVMTKEDIYDEQISPLMAQIIEVCQEHKIAMLAQFGIPNDEDPELVCTTVLLAPEYSPSPGQLQARKILRPCPQSFMIRTEHEDGATVLEE